MPAHWTDWNAPVSPSGFPLSTIIASVRTSVKTTPNAIAVTKTASVQYVGVPRAASRSPATAATAQLRMK